MVSYFQKSSFSGSPVTHTGDAPFDMADNYKLGYALGDCATDTLTISNPGGTVPPIICGINTGQHMWVPASDECNMLNFDIDTGLAGTTRSWQIKVTQFECNDLKAPEQDCLQWHTADTGGKRVFGSDRISRSPNLCLSVCLSVCPSLWQKVISRSLISWS